MERGVSCFLLGFLQQAQYSPLRFMAWRTLLQRKMPGMKSMYWMGMLFTEVGRWKTMDRILRRRRFFLENNGFLPGSGYGKTSMSICHVTENGTAVISKLSTTAANAIVIPFKTTIPIKPGDSVSIRFDFSSQPPSTFWNISLGGQLMCDNQNIQSTWKKIFTKTFSSGGELTGLYIQGRASSLSFAPPLQFKISLWINQMEVFL